MHKTPGLTKNKNLATLLTDAKLNIDIVKEVLAVKNELKKALDEYKEEIKKKGEEFFLIAFQPVFEAVPNLEMIRWTQYIPGFNDGDPCVFSTTFEYPEAVLKDAKDEDDYRELVTMNLETEGPGSKDWERRSSYMSEEDLNISWEISKVAAMFDEDDLETFFGADVEIRITKDDITVEEYDCGY